MAANPSVDKFGRTPLHYVSLDIPVEARIAEASRLIASGFSVNEKDKRGWTPLHFAAQEWAVDIAELLLKSGADVDSTDDHGNTPLSTAVFSSRGRGEVINLLRRYGADVHRANNHGVTPLSLARTIANYDVAQYFADI